MHLHCLQASVEELAGRGVVGTVPTELLGTLDDPECGIISTCLLQQHRAKGHQFLLVLRAIQWEVTCKGVWVCPCERVRGCHGGE